MGPHPVLLAEEVEAIDQQVQVHILALHTKQLLQRTQKRSKILITSVPLLRFRCAIVAHIYVFAKLGQSPCVVGWVGGVGWLGWLGWLNIAGLAGWACPASQPSVQALQAL